MFVQTCLHVGICSVISVNSPRAGTNLFFRYMRVPPNLSGIRGEGYVNVCHCFSLAQIDTCDIPYTTTQTVRSDR